jgi:hypothetical protein
MYLHEKIGTKIFTYIPSAKSLSIIHLWMFSFISKKFADIKILHEGYTADYFLNRMKPNGLFPILFIQNNLFKKKNSGTDIFYQIIAQCKF